MKTTLIYAGIAGYGFESLGKGMEAGWINHGLAQLSACAKAEGFDVDLIDLRGLKGWDEFRAELKQRRPDVTGLTMMSVDYNPVMTGIDVIKDVDPDIITVVGGPHPTLVLDEVMANPKIDYIVTHEAEITFPKLLAAIKRGEPPKERVLVGERPDLDAVPFVDRELFLDEWRRCGYAPDSPEVSFVPELPPPFLTIIAGRGCIYNCNFCQPAERIIFGRFRQRSAPNVIEELKLLQEKHHFASFMFHDDCLTNDREWVTEFCEAYKREGFTQPFFCQSRADIIV
ncbi:MAG: cobalamin B12-binding domain-containing protein, partial [Anaerolineales bacterium]|nr:cobalamin B12-binding domain-containing protein [Anaerolineales bacterium]